MSDCHLRSIDQATIDTVQYRMYVCHLHHNHNIQSPNNLRLPMIGWDGQAFPKRNGLTACFPWVQLELSRSKGALVPEATESTPLTHSYPTVFTTHSYSTPILVRLYLHTSYIHLTELLLPCCFCFCSVNEASSSSSSSSTTSSSSRLR